MAAATAELVPQTAAEFALYNLRDVYKCKVIENVGDFAYVVSVGLVEGKVGPTIKFQLPADYPITDCTIRLIVEGLPEETREELENQLLQTIVQLESRTDLSLVVKKAQQLYESVAESLCAPDLKTKKKSKSKQKTKKQKEDNSSPLKKPSMKTAEDVIKRIQWDPEFPKENFVVGYLDRFTGIEEKPFTAFSWEDLASVDYYTLAIPQHRIEYFKYRDVKVWDKPQRLDLVFGSTGSPATILDVIRTCDEVAEAAAANLTATPVAHPADDDSADDLELELGSFTRLQMSAKPDDSRPNYFLCLRVTNSEIVEKASNIQKHMLRLEPRYAECVIPEVCLHVTVACIGLDDAEDVRRCCIALEERTRDIQMTLPAGGLELNLSGVSNFQNRVVYAQVEQSDELMRFVQYVCSCLESANISIRNQFSYVPHMTLLKVSRPVSRQMKTKLVDPALYCSFSDTRFGCQPVTDMHLCSMEALRQSSGFYLSPYRVPLSN